MATETSINQHPDEVVKLAGDQINTDASLLPADTSPVSETSEVQTLRNNDSPTNIDAKQMISKETLPMLAPPKAPQLIDVEQFAEQATELAAGHVNQIAESNRIKLQELLNHQTILLESLEHENEKFSSSTCFSQMDETMKKCRDYHKKLIKVKKTMTDVTTRTVQIKRQCARLQELKAKSIVAEEEARRKEIERERMLVAQPVSISDEPEADIPS